MRQAMAMLSRLMAGIWQEAVDLRIGRLKVGQMRAGHEHWHSQTGPPLEPTTGDTNL